MQVVMQYIKKYGNNFLLHSADIFMHAVTFPAWRESGHFAYLERERKRARERERDRGREGERWR